jgi:hypothetical protein
MSTPKYKVRNLVVYLDGVNPEAGSRSRGEIVEVVSKNGEVFYKIDSDNTGNIETISEYAIVGGPSKAPTPFVPLTPLNTSHLGPPPAWGSEPKPPTLYQTVKNKAGTLASAAQNKGWTLAAAAQNKVYGLFGKSKRVTRKNKRRASRRKH